MPDPVGFKVKPYLITLLTLVGATAARLALAPLFADQYPFITFFPAVAIVGRFAGFRLAVASVCLGALSAAHFFFHPSLFLTVPTIADVVGVGLFLGLGFFIAWLTEQERQAKEAAVRSLDDLELQQKISEEQAALLQLASDGIFVLRLDGTIEFWNRGAEEMYGYSAAVARGRICHDLLKTVFPKPFEQLRQELLERSRWQGDLVHTRADGKQIDVSSRWVLRRSDGKPAGFLEITRDITERRKLDDKLRQTAKLEGLGVLAGGIAHDFNNLLTGIMGNASLALDSTRAVNPNRHLLEEIVGAAQHAAELTRQMLAYAGKGRFITQRVNLSELVRELSTLIQAAIPKNIQLRLDLLPEVAAVEGDIGQLQQIVMNLIINGAEAMSPDHPGAVLVTTSVQEVDEQYAATLALAEDIAPGMYVVLEVHDTGSGIDRQTLSKIFDPFFTTKFQGRGLGLAAVQGIVRSHKGGIKIYSTPGKGSTFKILLPAVPEAALPLHAAEVNEHDRLLGTGLVLVIDDEPFVRSVAKSTLEHYGYTVLIAANGKEGVDVFKLHRDNIAVVLLDLTMPEMGGEEALRNIKVLHPDVRVVLTSGFNEVEAVRQFTGKGLAGFIQKPYTASALAAKIKEVLGSPVSRSNWEGSIGGS